MTSNKCYSLYYKLLFRTLPRSKLTHNMMSYMLRLYHYYLGLSLPWYHTFCMCVCKRCNNTRCNVTGKCSTIFGMNKIYKGSPKPHILWKSHNISDTGCSKYHHAILHWHHHEEFTLKQKIQHPGQSVMSGAPCP